MQMKMSRNSTKAATIALVLVLTIAATLLTCLPAANAHTPAWTIPTWSYVALSQNPIGVGQSELITFWLNAVPPTAVGNFGDRWTFTVEVTKPDGTTKQTLGPITSDPVGGGYVSYVPDTVGNYSVVAKFSGKVITGLPVPPGGYFSPGAAAYINDTYQASASDPVILTVQQEAIKPWPEAPLPTQFWTRPINSANRDWYTLAGNWLAGPAQYNGPTTRFCYGTGPESAHVMWASQMWAGGIMDARFKDIGYQTGHYEGTDFVPPIILNGKIYYNVMSLPREGWYCLDLYTGKTEYFHNTTGPVTGVGGGFAASGSIAGEALSFGQIYDYESPNQHGGMPYLWSAPVSNPFAPPGPPPTWMMFDAYTGKYICSIKNVPSWVTYGGFTFGADTSVYGKDGSILAYQIAGTPDPLNPFAPPGPPFYLQCWNTSRAIWYKPFFASNDYWMWRPGLNVTYDGNNGYSLNVSIPNVQGSILAIREGKYVIGGTSGKHNSTYLQLGNLWALNLNRTQGAMGSLLWNKTFTPPETVVPDNAIYFLSFGGGPISGPIVDPEDGVFIFNEGMTRRWWGFSLDTMQMLWGPTEPEAAANFYAMMSDIYQGKLFTYGYGGVLTAYNIKTGKVLWKYTATNVGFESPYGNYPMGVTAIADGKLYMISGEHSPTQPLWRGCYLRCVDASTGAELWKILHWGADGGASLSGQYVVMADGFVVGLNQYDSRIYCYGKGPSLTTVSATPGVIANGSSVLIQGTVTDQSPGAKDTPAIADKDMEAWMEYLYMQQAMPTGATGVPVLLQAMRSDGTVTDIATVTSDIMGHFEYTWTPPTKDTYKILATFLGSKSYWMSSAETALGVSPAPAPVEIPPVEIPAYPDYTPMLVGIIAAVVIIGIANIVVTLRKRK